MPKSSIIYEDDNNPGEFTVVDTFNSDADAKAWLRGFVGVQCPPCEITADYIDKGYVSIQHPTGPVCEFRIASFKTVTEFTSEFTT